MHWSYVFLALTHRYSTFTKDGILGPNLWEAIIDLENHWELDAWQNCVWMNSDDCILACYALWWFSYKRIYIDGLVQERWNSNALAMELCNSSALAMELHLSYTYPSMCDEEIWQNSVLYLQKKHDKTSRYIS